MYRFISAQQSASLDSEVVIVDDVIEQTRGLLDSGVFHRVLDRRPSSHRSSSPRVVVQGHRQAFVLDTGLIRAYLTTIVKAISSTEDIACLGDAEPLSKPC